eukprot:TRINITY_DN29584_c0_g1_i1.p1 TRINITY_DN29584_c0_g1~~TRINITY_DN29584_c0_g1_i1.p1  ORF type:complete len:737 (-),score=94.64 TRINITY_DN29584_c0_g1_i1:1191-3134(-)
MPLLWLVYTVGLWRINVNWERGLRDGRAGRLAAASGRKRPPNLEAIWRRFSSGESELETEDEQVAAASSDECREESQDVSPSWASVFQRSRSAPGASLASLLAGCGMSDTRELSQARFFADLDAECLKFLQERVQVISFVPGEVVFEQGTPRDAFLTVQEGRVVVEATYQSGRRGEEYSLCAGDTVVGLLFVLASLDAGGRAMPPPSVCKVHSSSARAGSGGAQVASLPTSAIAEAFDKYPKAMQWLVQRLCIRVSMVVLETLSVHFGLRQEILVHSSYTCLPQQASDLQALAPADVFSSILGLDGTEGPDLRHKVDDEFATASTIAFEAGQHVFQPCQRAAHVLVLLEGELAMELQEEQKNDASQTLAGSYWEKQVTPGKLTITPGTAVGCLSILVDRPEPVNYKCLSACRFAALPKTAAQRLLDLCPKSWTLKLLHMTSAFTASWLHRVDACLDWLPVEGGRCLYRKGDAMLGFFVVLSGRLVALEEEGCTEDALDQGTRSSMLPSRARPRPRNRDSAETAKLKVIDVLQRGRLCGELDCLRDASYSGTVRASRDTEVCRVSPTLLHLIAIEFPKAILYFSSRVGGGLSTPGTKQADITHARHKATITIVPATDDVDVKSVCTNLTVALNKLAKTCDGFLAHLHG